MGYHSSTMKNGVRISKGNTKMGAIPSVSLPPHRTCNPDAPCWADCYAWRFYQRHEAVRNAYDSNLAIYHQNPDLYFDDIHEFLLRHRPSLFRFHVSGDFPDLSYFQTAHAIAAAYPDVRFLAFTKRFDLITAEQVRLMPENFTLVASAWPGWPIPDLRIPIAFMDDGSEDRLTGDEIVCPHSCEDCGECWHLKSQERNVVFPKH